MDFRPELVTSKERQSALHAFFDRAKRSASRVAVPVHRGPELIFDFGGGWVQGATPDQETVRLELARVTRFVIDKRPAHTDNWDYQMVFLAIATPEHKLLYTEHFSDNSQFPDLEPPVALHRAEANLAALVALAGKPACLGFPVAEPDRAFGWIKDGK